MCPIIIEKYLLPTCHKQIQLFGWFWFWELSLSNIVSTVFAVPKKKSHKGKTCFVLLKTPNLMIKGSRKQFIRLREKVAHEPDTAFIIE